MASEPASIRSIGSTLHWVFVRPGHDGSLSPLLASNDAEFYSFTFAHVPLDLVRVVPDYRCLVNEYVFAGVVAIDEAVSALHLELFNGSNHSYFVLAVVNVVLPLPKS